jgi:hypothetical protein
MQAEWAIAIDEVMDEARVRSHEASMRLPDGLDPVERWAAVHHKRRQ